MGADPKDPIEQAVVAVVPPHPALAPGGRRQGAHGKATDVVGARGTIDTVVWLKALSWSNRAIAQHLGCSASSVDRIVRMPEFAAMVEQTALDVTSRINEVARLRILNVMAEAVETKIALMREKRTNAYLRDKIATDLYQWGQEYIKTGGAGPEGANPLKAMLEMVQEIRGKDGTITKKRARVEGTPEQVAAAASSLPGSGDEPGAGGEGAGLDGAPGAGGGGERPA
jgi:hypothetical protein